MSKGNLRDIELIVIDIDGTLINDEGKIAEETRLLVNELQHDGVKFSLATGRLHSAATKFARELNINIPLISLDGCLLKSFPANEVLYESYVKAKHVRRTIELADQCLLNICLCHADAIYYTENNSVIPRITEKFGARFELVESYDNYLDGTLEVLMAAENIGAAKYVLDKMSFPYCTGLNKSFFRSHSYDHVYYLEIRRSGSSKGKGLQRLFKYLNIPAQRTAVVGDWFNDLSLFQKKTINVAVGNAVAELKINADIITSKTNNDGAVAEFLTMVLNSKR